VTPKADQPDLPIFIIFARLLSLLRRLVMKNAFRGIENQSIPPT